MGKINLLARMQIKAGAPGVYLKDNSFDPPFIRGQRLIEKIRYLNLQCSMSLTYSIHLNFRILFCATLSNSTGVIPSIRFCYLVYFQRAIIKHSQTRIRLWVQFLAILLPRICWLGKARNAKLDGVTLSNFDLLMFVNFLDVS